MKLSGAAVDRFIKGQGAETTSAVLLYGPNYGMISDSARAILARGGGEATELRGSAILDDPASLNDAAYASSLFGGGAPVYVRDATEKLATLLEELLGAPDPQRNLIVIEASELTPKSKLRALFETAPHLAAIACYEEKGEALAARLSSYMTESGYRLLPEASDYIVDRLPGDRAAQNSEMEKLILYAGDKKEIGLKEAIATIGDAAEIEVYDLPWLVFSGEAPAADKALARLHEANTSEIQILRALLSHAMRLHAAQSSIRAGQSQSQAMESLRPPVWRSDQGRFQQNLRRWTLPALTKTITALTECERLCKSTGYPGPALMRQLATQIGQRVL